MSYQNRKLWRRIALNLFVHTNDMLGVWAVYFLAFGLWPVGWWGWFWLITIGLGGRFLLNGAVGMYWHRREKDRWHTTIALRGKDHAVTFTLHEAKQLVEFFGGEEGRASVMHVEDGHSGPGLYVWATEYPEEGSLTLSTPYLLKRAPRADQG